MATKINQKIMPFLWFEKDAEEAVRFYTSIFPDSRIDRVSTMPAESPSGPPGSVKVVDFTLFSQRFSAMGAADRPEDFGHAVSFMITCDNQAEVDRYWT